MSFAIPLLLFQHSLQSVHTSQQRALMLGHGFRRDASLLYIHVFELGKRELRHDHLIKDFLMDAVDLFSHVGPLLLLQILEELDVLLREGGCGVPHVPKLLAKAEDCGSGSSILPLQLFHLFQDALYLLLPLLIHICGFGYAILDAHELNSTLIEGHRCVFLELGYEVGES